MVDQTVLRELGRLTLAELLELTILIAGRDPRRHARVSARWLLRHLEFARQTTIDYTAMVVGWWVFVGRSGDSGRIAQVARE